MDQGSVIRRKAAAAARPAPAETGAPVGAARALPLALARTARDRMSGLTVDAQDLSLNSRSLAELLDLIPDLSLIALLDGPGEGIGVIALSPPLLAGLIEAQTLGRVTATPLVARRPTRTDAAMLAGFLDAVMTGLETALAQDPDLVWTDGFRYASVLDDARPLALIMDQDMGYRVFAGEVALGGEAGRSGPLILALPAEGRGRRPQKPAAAGAGLGTLAESMVFAAALSEQVNAAECPLTAVLAHLRLPLAEVLRLGAGAVLPLPTAAIDRIDLVGADGRRISGGKLGQTRGMRAVRHEPDSAGSGLSDGAVAAVAAVTRPGARPPPAGLGPAHSANPPRTGTEG